MNGSAILQMNERGLREHLTMLVQFQRKQRGIRDRILEKQSAAEVELREHDMVAGIVTEQVALIHARLSVLEQDKQEPAGGQPEQETMET